MDVLSAHSGFGPAYTALLAMYDDVKFRLLVVDVLALHFTHSTATCVIINLSFRVGSSEAGWSAVFSFTSAPDPAAVAQGKNSFTFLVFNDVGQENLGKCRTSCYQVQGADCRLHEDMLFKANDHVAESVAALAYELQQLGSCVTACVCCLVCLCVAVLFNETVCPPYCPLGWAFDNYTTNSTKLVKQLSKEEEARLALLVGDLSYANGVQVHTLHDRSAQFI